MRYRTGANMLRRHIHDILLVVAFAAAIAAEHAPSFKHIGGLVAILCALVSFGILLFAPPQPGPSTDESGR
jgi:hypothetical protein